MGLAASQARLLMLTARKSDLELRAQQLTNTDMILAMQTEQIAKKYSNKLSNKKLMLVDSVNVMDPGKTQDGEVSLESLLAKKYIAVYAKTETSGERPVDDITDPKVLQNLIKRGVILVYNRNEETGAPMGEAINIAGSSDFYDTYDTSDDAAATAEYESKMAEIQTKEKQLQIDLQQVETQQKACETEIDSVKKIIDKNIERSFKIFA